MSLQSLVNVFAYVDALVDTPEDKLTGNHVLVLNAIAHHTDQHGTGPIRRSPPCNATPTQTPGDPIRLA